MRISQKQSTEPTTEPTSHTLSSRFANRTYKMFSDVKHFFWRIFHAITQIAHRIFHKVHESLPLHPKEQYADKHKLLVSKKEVRESEYHWHLNLALLRNAERSTQDPETLRKLQFLEANYLKKAAPPMMEWMLELEKNVEKRFQLSPFADATYHREGFRQQMQLGANIFNKKLALEHESPLLLTDTTDFAHFFPVRYTVVNDTTQSSKTQIEDCCIDHFGSFANPQDGLQSPLRPGILFDGTNRFQELIKTGKDRKKEAQFRSEFASFKNEVEALIEKSVSELHKRYPSLSEAQLRQFLHKNITCVCRVQLGTVAGMKVLPLFADLSKDRL